MLLQFLCISEPARLLTPRGRDVTAHLAPPARSAAETDGVMPAGGHRLGRQAAAGGWSSVVSAR